MNAQLSYARNGMLRNSFMRWRRWESPIYRYLFDDLEDTDFRVFFRASKRQCGFIFLNFRARKDCI